MNTILKKFIVITLLLQLLGLDVFCETPPLTSQLGKGGGGGSGNVRETFGRSDTPWVRYWRYSEKKWSEVPLSKIYRFKKNGEIQIFFSKGYYGNDEHPNNVEKYSDWLTALFSRDQKLPEFLVPIEKFKVYWMAIIRGQEDDLILVEIDEQLSAMRLCYQGQVGYLQLKDDLKLPWK